jgi:hypothetical protein
MKRWFAAGALALVLMLAVAGSAEANKNRQAISATCGSQSAAVFVNFRASEQAAAPVAGGGSFKTTSLTLFLHGTNQEVFSVTTNYPGQPTVTCTGTFLDPDSGQLLDFTVSGVLRPGK